MDSQQQHQLLPAKHVGSFLLLMFIATFRPTAIWPNFPISLEPIAVLAIALLLFYKIYATIGFKVFYQKYKVELLLLAAYFSVCFLSLYLNRFRYKDIHEIIRYGITFIVITMSFPAAIFLFLLPQNKIGFSLSRFNYSGYLPWGYFALLALMAIWQYVDLKSAALLGNYFVSSELISTSKGGFFRVSTDLGSVLGLALVCFFSQLLVIKDFVEYKRRFVCNVLLILLIIFAGVVSGTRVFYLIIIMEFIFILFLLIRYSFFAFILLLLFMIFIFHLIVYFGPDALIYKMSYFFHYLYPFMKGDVIFLEDFIPDFSSSSFTERSIIWETAVGLIKQNYIYGISNGGFRLLWESKTINTHSLLFQPFIDAGFFGFVFLFLLTVKCVSAIFKKVNKSYVFLIVLPILSSVLVDFQLDHSLPWIVSIAYLMLTSPFILWKNITLNISINHVKHQKYLIIFILLTAPLIFIIYYANIQSLKNLSMTKRVEHFISSRAFDSLLLIDESIGVDLNSDYDKRIKNSEITSEVKLPKNACLYQHLNAKFIFPATTNELHRSNNDKVFQGYNSSFIYSDSLNLNCKEFLYPHFSDLTIASWVSNFSYYLARNDLKYWTLYQNVEIYSALFYLPIGEYTFKFTAKGQFGLGEWPILELSLLGMNFQNAFYLNKVRIDNSQYTNYVFNFKVKPKNNNKPLYLKINYMNDAIDYKVKQDRNVFIDPSSFEMIHAKNLDVE